MAVSPRISNEGPARPKILSGWKEIAAYVKKSVRSVQRYERFHGLPVRRPQGGTRTGVIATMAELDAWVLANPIRDEFALPAPGASDSAMAALRVGMSKMLQLCEDVRQTKNEVKAAVEVLQSSIRVAGMRRTHPLSGDLESTLGFPEKGILREDESNLFFYESKKRKAN